ncbi:lipocalin family protein [Chitinophaga sp. 30R24]|uniref:lipocalin family protein n=1 Tax=Chitinophaga sp. 30R24 TaxID=3248838 RepID=UPI003B8FFBA4
MNNKKLFAIAAAAAVGIILYSNCKVTIPKGARAVSPFDVRKYLGTWFEIARMNYRFERNLTNVSATYSLDNHGNIKVVNKGFNMERQAWKEVTGKARFVKHTDQGRLKVSFFGPFYAGYSIIDIDEHYRHALVVGNSLDYMWILSRTPSIPADIKARFLTKAKQLGYNTPALVWTRHDQYYS